VFIPVLTPNPQYGVENNFTVCLSGPVKSNYSNIPQFIEWIEANSMFGAEKFVIYLNSVADALYPHIKRYEQEGKLESYSWNLRMNEIKTCGQMALLTDCMYRNMYKSKYVVFLDLDEILVPKMFDTWQNVLEYSNCEEHASANFQNVFFKLEWEPDTRKTVAKELNITSLMYSKRETKIWPHRARSKYLVQPELIAEPGVHSPHRYFGGGSECDVASEVAWVQHYRLWGDPSTPWVEDKAMWRHAEALIHRVQEAKLAAHKMQH
jgi:hypothetical protein